MNFLIWSRSHLLLLLIISPFFFLNHPSLPMSFPDHSCHHTNITETYKASPILKTNHFLDVTPLSSPSIFVPLYSKAPQKHYPVIDTSSHPLLSPHPTPPPFAKAPALKRYPEIHCGWGRGVHVAKSTDPKFKLLDFSAGFVTISAFSPWLPTPSRFPPPSLAADSQSPSFSVSFLTSNCFRPFLL